MYKNKTIYDLELVLLSQQGMLKQTKIVSAVFAIVIYALGVASIFLNKITMGVCLFIAATLILVLFVFLSGWFLKLTMQKNLKDRSVVVEYLFSNNLTITSYVDGQTITQSFDYHNIFQMIEQESCLVICPSKNDALIMRKDDKFLEYRNFIQDKMQDRYLIEIKKDKTKNKVK